MDPHQITPYLHAVSTVTAEPLTCTFCGKPGPVLGLHQHGDDPADDRPIVAICPPCAAQVNAVAVTLPKVA